MIDRVTVQSTSRFLTMPPSHPRSHIFSKCSLAVSPEGPVELIQMIWKWPHLLLLAVHLATLVHGCRRLSRLFQNIPFALAAISSSSSGTSKRSQTRWMEHLIPPVSSHSALAPLDAEEQQVSSDFSRKGASCWNEKSSPPSLTDLQIPPATMDSCCVTFALARQRKFKSDFSPVRKRRCLASHSPWRGFESWVARGGGMAALWSLGSRLWRLTQAASLKASLRAQLFISRNTQTQCKLRRRVWFCLQFTALSCSRGRQPGAVSAQTHSL